MSTGVDNRRRLDSVCVLKHTDSINGMVLAAGKATRLGQLSGELPKAMLPLCNRPLIDWALDLLHQHGIRDAAINLHHLGEVIETHVMQSAAHAAMKLRFSHETELMGTGGGIRQMSGLLPRRTTVVVNGKLVTDVDLTAVLAEHYRDGNVATMVLFSHPNAKDWGAVNLDESGRVVRLLDQRIGSTSSTNIDYMFTGIHILEPELIEAIPEEPCCVIRTAYRTLLAKGARVGGYVHSGYFYEHSTPARYLQGNINLLEGMLTPDPVLVRLTGVAKSACIANDAIVRPPVLIGEHVRVGSAAVIGPHTVIGADASIRHGVHIERGVVWPDTHVMHSLCNAIAMPGQVIDASTPSDPMLRPRD